MKIYDELKAKVEAIQQQIVEAKKNRRVNALEKVKLVCKELFLTAGKLEDSLAEGSKQKKIWRCEFILGANLLMNRVLFEND